MSALPSAELAPRQDNGNRYYLPPLCPLFTAVSRHFITLSFYVSHGNVPALGSFIVGAPVCLSFGLRACLRLCPRQVGKVTPQSEEETAAARASKQNDGRPSKRQVNTSSFGNVQVQAPAPIGQLLGYRWLPGAPIGGHDMATKESVTLVCV